MEVNTALLITNWALFILVTGYAVFLFAYLVITRIKFIQLGKKSRIRPFNERTDARNLEKCIWS